MATGSALSDAAENLVLNWLMTAGAATRPTTWFVSLHTADPTEAGTGTEVSGSAYARTAVTFGAASGGSCSNTGTVTFPTATGTWGTVTHCAIQSAASGNTVLFYGPLSASASVTSGITYSFPAASLVCSLD